MMLKPKGMWYGFQMTSHNSSMDSWRHDNSRFGLAGMSPRAITPLARFAWHDLTLIPAWICNYIPLKCEMELLIHSQILMVA